MERGPERFAVPFAKALLFRPGDDAFLVQRRSKPGDRYFGFWEVPGGRVREGESLLDALAREVREETGIERLAWLGQEPAEEADRFGGRVRVLQPLVTVEIVAEDRPIFGQYFAAEVRGDVPAATEEARDHRWIRPAEFRREFLDAPPDRRACTTVDVVALRLALEGPLDVLLSRRRATGGA